MGQLLSFDDAWGSGVGPSKSRSPGARGTWGWGGGAVIGHHTHYNQLDYTCDIFFIDRNQSELERICREE